MTKTEVTEFLQRMKTEYPFLQIKEKYVLEEWYKALKPYDAYDVNLKLDEHLNGNYKHTMPTPSFITKYLKTPEEKAKNNKNLCIYCNLCKKPMTLKQYDDHYSRCLSEEFLIQKLKKRGKDFTHNDFDEISEVEFDGLYKQITGVSI